MNVSNPITWFWNSSERRIRAFWRLCLYAMMFLLLTIVISLIAAFSGIHSPTSAQPIVLLATFLSLWLAGRFLDRRPMSDFGLVLNASWWLDMAFGLVLGAALMTGIFVIEYAAGWITIRETFANPTSTSFAQALMTPLIAFICVGIYEELITRGYLLRNLAEGLSIGPISPTIALLLAWFFSSWVFGLLHALNPHATIISTINLAVAGLFLGLGPILTGRLSLAIGLHITWNFFQGHVFGFPVSGFIYHPATVFAIEQQGDSRWTGGEFGPEAGIIGLLAMLVGGLIIVLWVFVREQGVSLAKQFLQYRWAET